LILALLSVSAFPAAFANDLNALLLPETNIGESNFIGIKNISMQYDQGAAVSNAIGKDGFEDIRITERINGTRDSGDQAVISAISALNRALLDSNSPAQVTAVQLTYTAVVKPRESSITFSFKVEAVPLIENYVIGEGSNDGYPSKLVDLEWRGIHVTEPILVPVADLGTVDINRPISLIEKLYPEIAGDLKSSESAEIFDEPTLDFERFDQNMETWHFLIDPTGSQVEATAYLRDQAGAKVDSVYAIGESSIREGTFEAEEKDARATILGEQVTIHSQEPAPSGQIRLAGYSKLEGSQEAEHASVSMDGTTGTTFFSYQVLLVFGGMMGAIAIFILIKARK
jgi:hypothetical protein